MIGKVLEHQGIQWAVEEIAPSNSTGAIVAFVFDIAKRTRAPGPLAEHCIELPVQSVRQAIRTYEVAHGEDPVYR